MISQEQLINWTNDCIKDESLFVVSVKIKDDDISVFIDGDNGVSIDNCSEISSCLNKILEENISDNYNLTVSSYGLGSPLKLIRQYKNHINDEVAVVLKNKEKINGVISKVNDENFELIETKKIKKEIQTTTHCINYNDVKTTKQIIKF